MSIAKNYIYNVIYQIVTLIIPLITVPYISRVLGSSGIGINAYTNSVIQYFILFGTIGITLYGNRSIAYVRDNKIELSKTFWEIFTLKIMTVTFSFVVFLLFLFVTDSYQTIFLIQSIHIIAVAIDISWLYMGLEDFKKTVVRNLIVKLIGVCCIFIFVNDVTDLWKYIFILAISQLFGQIVMWFYLPKTVDKVKLSLKGIKKHIKPSISLFIPQIAIQIYVVLNKTMLGNMANINEVGFFDNSEKIIKITLSIVTAMGVVMLPRISNTFAKGNIEQVRYYMYQSFNFVSYLSIPMMFGIAGIANEFTPWFFGTGFNTTGTLIVLLSPIILFIGWSNVVGIQFLMPVGRIKEFTLSVCIGAIVNFILNLVLIKYYQSIGTAISTVAAEFTVIAVQLYMIRREIIIKKLFSSIWKYLTSGFIMYILSRIIGITLSPNILTTIIQIVVGIVSYITLLYIFNSEINRKIVKFGLNKVKIKSTN